MTAKQRDRQAQVTTTPISDGQDVLYGVDLLESAWLTLYHNL